MIDLGDYLHVRNVGIRGNQKLVDRWEHTPYIVKDQPNLDIPVYAVQQEATNPTQEPASTIHGPTLFGPNAII